MGNEQDQINNFRLHATFESLNKFIDLYFKLHHSGSAENIDLTVSLPRISKHIGEPNQKRNVLLTAEFYIDQIQSANLRGETTVRIHRDYPEDW